MINAPLPHEGTRRHRWLLVQGRKTRAFSGHARPHTQTNIPHGLPPRRTRILITVGAEITATREKKARQKRARWISRRLMRRFISLTFQSIIVHPWDPNAATLFPLSSLLFLLLPCFARPLPFFLSFVAWLRCFETTRFGRTLWTNESRAKGENSGRFARATWD